MKSPRGNLYNKDEITLIDFREVIATSSRNVSKLNLEKYRIVYFKRNNRQNILILENKS